MGGFTRISERQSSASNIALTNIAAFLLVLLAAYSSRRVLITPNAALQGYLQAVTGLLSFIFAAVALVRFQGTQDRISLILGSGFLLSGTVLMASSVLFFQLSNGASVPFRWAPLAWWASRMVLALLLMVALLVEHFLPRSRHPRGEIAGALLTVIGMTYLITATLRRMPAEVSPHPGSFVPSPQQLLPAVLFIVALVWFRRRLAVEHTAFDNAIYSAAWMNLAAQLAACQSERLLDAPFVLAQALTVMSYAIAVGGALLDNARLFEQVRHLAVSDPLTGLANYRRLLDVLDSETERTNRNNRPFAILLLDLDGLKRINDSYGHLVGSRAITRLAEILRIHCRTVDTAARYGGDEFALVLPETEEADARLVAQRIHAVLGEDAEQPPLSASIGIAIYRGDGARIEQLLSDADKHLYAEKARRVKSVTAAAAASQRRRAPQA
jgi:diguanylate cyclase (GGDEF)-like protein